MMKIDAPCRPGDRIELLSMGDDPCPIDPGERGTVLSVNGGFYRNIKFTITVKWDNNRSLALVWPTDKLAVLADEEQFFRVEAVEPDVFQSVFPSWLADKSSLHATEADAWNHINIIRNEKDAA